MTDTEVMIEKLTDATDRVKSAEREFAEAKAERDQLVAEARKNGVKYNDISKAVDMSISWINASLLRTDGYRPRAGRPRRLQKTA
jgi:hypothetical protein